MSAIAGILYFNGAPAKPGMVEILTDAMKTRGSDEQTHWIEDSVALGHCMLRTTPESLAEHQPLLSQDGNLVLVWDGRLDNRQELTTNLRLAGVTPRGNTDAELVLQSYAVWGEQCPTYLLGDFAFAIWDKRQQRLFCARDHFGAKQFSYTVNSHFFAFASSEESLPRLPGVSNKPNEDRIAYSLLPDFDSFDTNQGWMKDIWALPDGETLTVDRDSTITRNRYWKLEPGEENNYDSDEACIETFLALFSQAVQCRLRTISSPSAMISGGIDSACIMAMLCRLLPATGHTKINSYSVVADDYRNCVESQCIHSLTSSTSIKASFDSIPSLKGGTTVNDLMDLAWNRAHPVENSILIPSLMYRAAGRSGDRVMLHGASGDLVNYVPPRYIGHFLRKRQLHRAWSELRTASPGIGNPITLLLLNIWSEFMPEKLKLFARSIHHPIKNPLLGTGLINPDFAARIRLQERMKFSTTLQSSATTPTQAHANAINGMYSIVSGHSASGRVAHHWGVEPRDPWADKRLVEFFLNLPLHFKVRDGLRKYIPRMAFKSDLAPLVLNRRTKEHLGWELKVALMEVSSNMLSRDFEHHLDITGQYVDTRVAKDAWNNYLRTKDSYSLETAFEFFTLAFWLKRISSL